MTSTTTFTPAEAVERTGVSLDTLRYYERIGLLALARDAAGHRVFTDGDLDWIGLLRCLRETGMPIAQMQRYASPSGTQTARDDEVTIARHRLEILRAHGRRVASDIDRLLLQQQRLADKLAWYGGVVERAGRGVEDAI